MALTTTEVGEIAEDLYSIAEDIIKLKKRKKKMTKAEVKTFRNRFLQIAVKLTIDAID